MAGEIVFAYGTPKVLESAGAISANNTVVKADDAIYDLMADGGGFPDAVFALTCTFSGLPNENSPVNLYARTLGTDGVNDSDVPETTRPGRMIGQFYVNNTTTLQALELMAYDLPLKAEYYIHNYTGNAIAAGWSLRVTPRTYKVL